MHNHDAKGQCHSAQKDSGHAVTPRLETNLGGASNLAR